MSPQRVDRRHREVAALHRRAVAHVARLVVDAGRPRRFLGLDLHRAARHVDVPGDAVEDEELGLGAEVGDVAQAGRLQIGLGALGDRARVAVVGLAVHRLVDVAADVQHRLVGERIHARARRVRHQQHVGGLDALPAGDRGAVEGVAELELLLVEVLHRHGDVLLLAAGIGEAEVDELDFLVLDELQYVIGGHRHLRVS